MTSERCWRVVSEIAWPESQIQKRQTLIACLSSISFLQSPSALSDNDDVLGLRAFLALCDVEFNGLAFYQCFEA